MYEWLNGALKQNFHLWLWCKILKQRICLSSLILYTLSLRQNKQIEFLLMWLFYVKIQTPGIFTWQLSQWSRDFSRTNNT